MTEVYSRALEDMLLACADTAITTEEFAGRFAVFGANIFRLRKEYFEIAHHRETNGFFSGRWPGTPYRRLSKYTIRTLMGDGTVQVKEDRTEVERFQKFKEQLEEQAKSLEIRLSDAQKSEPKQ